MLGCHHGVVYDVTGTFGKYESTVLYILLICRLEFHDSHPGGPTVIFRCAGKDATEDFDSVHPRDLLKEALTESAIRGY